MENIKLNTFNKLQWFPTGNKMQQKGNQIYLISAGYRTLTCFDEMSKSFDPKKVDIHCFIEWLNRFFYNMFLTCFMYSWDSGRFMNTKRPHKSNLAQLWWPCTSLLLYAIGFGRYHRLGNFFCFQLISLIIPRSQ